MKHDIFVGLQRIIDKDCALVRVLNQGGIPYSIILEQQPNGEFWEVCCTPTLGDNDSISESEMINNYLAAKELGQKQRGQREMKKIKLENKTIFSASFNAMHTECITINKVTRSYADDKIPTLIHKMEDYIFCIGRDNESLCYTLTPREAEQLYKVLGKELKERLE